MNVLYLTNNAGKASTTVPTQGWFQHLMPSGLRPVLASPLTGEFSEWTTQRDGAAYQVALPFPSKTRPWSFLRSIWKLRQIVRRHRIELIHSNEQDVYPISSYLARLCGLPVVVSVHFTMGRPFCAWAFGGRRQPDRIFFISRGNLEACRPGVEGIIDSARWGLLHNGLDADHFRPDADRRRQFRDAYGLGDVPLIGVACALRERKQLEHLFEAARSLPPGVKVVVAGGSVPDERQYAEALIERGKRELGDRLVHVGHLDELRGFYNALDLFVNTSREEACSISVLEAMACGCPVVGYPSKSVDTQVLPGGGEMVEQDRVDQLVPALRSWLGDPGKLAAGKEGARRRVQNEFDSRAVSLQLWDEYQAVLEERRTRPARTTRAAL